ncbi:DUF647-domain-containing protein [Fomitiporia mediterranea MF3/22]|uniref:DUF647-domain-containing protein n=1 Tax=Fomitiporia mediterranea (strain MF3/22) TaxID=694068 RepID=UPI0004409C10|nr:DUF647-domain-containing protein [Fomitiporia mediterranea MF3/22]EJD02652.1 DUF647-domain-containing protein [Fomitiporia mediterranea MF3/22]
MSVRVTLSEAEGSVGLGPEYRIKSGTKQEPKESSARAARKIGSHTLSEIFLPSGFPDSVTPDYIGYQIFDSLQAFSSSIAGLLSSRAVLEGFGVGNENASSTHAVLLTVLQDATGRLATILFAWKFGPALAPEAKMYRLAADIFNDSAFVLDCLSPALPTQLRIAALCLAGALRAICGVCGGGAKAALSVHFARTGNVGELNAKDASQETVIGLFGMLCGSFVMAHITSRRTTWIALIFLLTAHLVTNYLAVRAVTLTTLSRQRTNIAYGVYCEQSNNVLTPSEVARRERIFEVPGAIRDSLQGFLLGTCTICTSPEELLRRSRQGSMASWKNALVAFEHEAYVLLGIRADFPCKILICFKHGAKPEDYLKAWVNAVELCRIAGSRLQVGQESNNVTPGSFSALQKSLECTNTKFLDFLDKANKAGWDLKTDAICTMPVRTMDFVIDDGEMKKDK